MVRRCEGAVHQSLRCLCGDLITEERRQLGARTIADILRRRKWTRSREISQLVQVIVQRALAVSLNHLAYGGTVAHYLRQQLFLRILPHFICHTIAS